MRIVRRADLVARALVAGEEAPERLVEDGAQEGGAGHEDDDARLCVCPGDDLGDGVGEVVEVDAAQGE